MRQVLQHIKTSPNIVSNTLIAIPQCKDHIKIQFRVKTAYSTFCKILIKLSPFWGFIQIRSFSPSWNVILTFLNKY
jgi:hypothetical protein